LYGAFELGLFRQPESFEIEWLERASESIAAHFFNHKINAEAKQQLETLTQKQAAELVEIHRLQRETFSELELKLKEVEEEKRKNVAILEGCVDGVIVFHTNGRIDFCNQAAAEILGQSREEILQHAMTSLLPVVIKEQNGVARAIYRQGDIYKEIAVRTEASFCTTGGVDTDVLITCTQARINTGVVFTFFIQKISVDLF
jgi:PAS domain S-box-containing protein